MSLTMLDTLRKENGGEPIRAVLYARYSSDMQREESIEAQVEAIMAFAAKENIVVIRQYIDKALTGTSDNRPDFQRMIADSKLKEFQLLLVHKTDRFSRNTYNSVVYRHMLRANGVRFLAVAQPLDEDKPEDKLLDTLLTAMASYYSDNLRGEVLKGLRINAENACHTGGIPPLGYDIGTNKHLVINEKEAEAVRMIFKMVLEGHKYSDILFELRINGYKTKASKEFGKTSLNSILHNRKYVGDYVYNRTYGKDPVSHKRNSHKERPISEQIIVKDAIPAIISREDFFKVQDLLLQRKHFARVSKTKYLLTGKIFCGICNSSYNGNCKLPNKKRLTQNPTYTYRCSNRSNRIDKSVCNNKEINREQLESYILSQIEHWVFNPETISSITEKYQSYVVKMASDSNKKISRLENTISSLNRELENLTDKYISTDNLVLQKRIDERIKERDSLRIATEEALRREKASINIVVPNKKEISRIINKAREQFKAKTLDELFDLVQVFVDRITVYEDYIAITFNFIPGIDNNENLKRHVKISREILRSQSWKTKTD